MVEYRGRLCLFPGTRSVFEVEVEVEIGLTDGVYTEITSGLEEGDNIIPIPSSLNDQSGGGPPD